MSIKRILRVIEYVGDDEFLAACIDKRVIKGTFIPGRPGCYIREAILGDTPEILKQATQQEATQDGKQDTD